MSWSGSALEEPLPMRGDSSVGVDNTTAEGASYSNGLVQVVDDEGSNASFEQGNSRGSKRRRIEDSNSLEEDGEDHEEDEEDEEEEEDGDVQMENGIDGVAVHAPPVPVPASVIAAPVVAIDPNDPRIPHFKPGLPDPDDKGENDCFFEDCLTRAGGNQYFVKHLIDKHCLIRGDQGRSEGGRRKTPKYLTLCPTDWPFTHGASSSCTHCSDITTLLNVQGDQSHESPVICSFCWTYFDSRAGLITHINEGPCKSNEGFARKLTLIRHMLVSGLRNPQAAQISQASEGQRKAHAEAERVARAEKYALEQQLHEQAQVEWRAHTQAQRAQRQQRIPTPPRPQGGQAAAGAYSSHRFTPNATPPTGQQQQQAVHPVGAPVASMGAPIPPAAAADGLVPAYQPAAQAAVDYAVPSATVEAMARSIERLSGIIGDLTAANTRLLQEVQLRDQQVSGRDQQVRSRDERIIALSAENKKLVAEVARLTERVEILEQSGGGDVGGRGIGGGGRRGGGGADMSDGGDTV
ncbi:hypothetical protein QBC44DRAFT_382876 [Cladorrhinum sp. PSN332]|nr:hypothetical protein QBC44DRAFT_382876 [Cladorrhinum sp. PSN332]